MSCAGETRHQRRVGLLVRGGASFARELIGLGLVDEYRLLQHPIALAAG